MKALLIVLATALCAVAGLWVITLTSNHPDGATSPPPTVAVAPVAVPEPAKPAVIELPEPVGRLESGADVEIRPALNGYVPHFKVNEGDFVQKGQLLAELGDSKLADAVTHAEAALQLAKAQLAARESRLASAEQPSQSSLGAARSASLGLPQSEIEIQKRALKADSALDQARINQAEAGLQNAKQALAQTRIVAPIAGLVAQRLSDTGELSKTDVVLLRIVDVATVKLSLDVSGALLGTAATGQEAHVTVDAFPDRYFFGRVVSKAQAPASSGSSLCIEVGNPEKLLKPGMYAHVRLMFDRLNQPKMAAVQRPAGKTTPGTPVGGATAATDVVASLAALTKTLGAEAQEIQRKETAARATAEATRQYFGMLERLVGDLRLGKRSRSSLERAADKIDGAPTLHVDDELLAFGVEVSKTLREIAERRRAIARVNDVPDLSYGQRAQIASNALRTLGLLEIHNGLVDMRRKLTKKYDLEFLATVTPTSSSAALRDTRHARR
jgi:RND family efflux transporter MFP subunit